MMDTVKTSGRALLDAEMARQHKDALDSIAANTDAARRVADSVARTGRLVLLGMGASHWVNRVAEALYREIGVDVTSHVLSEVLDTPLPPGARTILVTSQSGRSGEVVRYLDHATLGGEERFGLTLDPSGDLAARATCLIGAGGIEVAFAATRSLLICLALHAAIRAALGHGSEAALKMLRDPPAPEIAAALAALAAAPTLALTGRGALAGVAEAGGLCLMELGRQPALAMEAAQLRHGPMEALGPATGIVALRGPGPTSALIAAFLADARAAGAPCVVLDASGEAQLPDVTTIALPRADGYACVFAIVPTLQRLLIARSATQVARVGEPVHSTKVTTVL